METPSSSFISTSIAAYSHYWSVPIIITISSTAIRRGCAWDGFGTSSAK